MKKSLYSVFTVALLSTPCLLAQETEIKPLEATLVTTTICSGLPAGLDFMEKPNSYQEGTSLTFFLQGENLVSFDKYSFKAEGWKLGFFNDVSKNGKTATLNISNKKITKPEDIKLNGSIDILVGSKTATKSAILKKGAKLKFKGFTAELSSNGVKVVGDYASIKTISVKNDGKKLESNGTSWVKNKKTYSFNAVKEGAELTIEYWTDLKKKTVKFSK